MKTTEKFQNSKFSKFNLKENSWRCIYVFLIMFGLLSVSCQKGETEKAEDKEKMEIFDNCLKLSFLHSDYLNFIRENNYNIVSLSDKKDFYKVHEKLAYKFIEKSSFLSMYPKATKDNIVTLSTVIPEREVLTKSASLNKTEKLGNELISNINELIMTNTVDYNQIVRITLQKDKYLSCSKEEFLILSISATTYLDSIRYWEKNINLWMNADESLKTKSWSWNRVWGYVKQFAQADAEAGLETAIGCAILGPVSLEAAFVGAGVGSAFECGKTIAAML